MSCLMSIYSIFSLSSLCNFFRGIRDSNHLAILSINCDIYFGIKECFASVHIQLKAQDVK